MNKQSKITVKHFLNTNLKPYLINGIKHYSIYLILVAFRQNTKVKSITFNEYYSEENFNEIINSKDVYDKNLINNEVNTITIISEIVTKELTEFDTAFITAYFKYCTTVSISSLESYYFLKSKKTNDKLLDFDLTDFLKENSLNNKTLFNFYGNTIQNKFEKYIEENLKITDIEDTVNLFNTAYFYDSLEGFKENILKSKNSYLVDKYNSAFYLIKDIKQNTNSERLLKNFNSIDWKKNIKN